MVQGDVLRLSPRLTQRKEEGRHSEFTWNLCSGGVTALTPHPSNLSHPSWPPGGLDQLALGCVLAF